jgi:hypothetical protein
MIEERKKIEFWNYLTNEKNQPRPKGITPQRLAVIKPEVLNSTELWFEVIERFGAESKTAPEFYQSSVADGIDSRATFWEKIRRIIVQGNLEREKTGNATETKNRLRSGKTDKQRVSVKSSSRNQTQSFSRKKQNVQANNRRNQSKI